MLTRARLAASPLLPPWLQTAKRRAQAPSFEPNPRPAQDREHHTAVFVAGGACSHFADAHTEFIKTIHVTGNAPRCAPLPHTSTQSPWSVARAVDNVADFATHQVTFIVARLIAWWRRTRTECEQAIALSLVGHPGAQAPAAAQAQARRVAFIESHRGTADLLFLHVAALALAKRGQETLSADFAVSLEQFALKFFRGEEGQISYAAGVRDATDPSSVPAD
jgi:hypothetical protein